jgi:hypothetical protein
MTWHTIRDDFDLSTYLQGLEVESLPTFCLDTGLSELAKSKNIHETSYSKGNGTESCPHFRYGTTCEISTESRGAEQLTFFAEDSLVKTSVRQVREQELPESVQDYGKSMRDSLERCGLSLSLPKTHLCFALGDLELSSKIWPRWGMMLDGECWELATSVRPTKETECGSWPTPATRDYKGGHSPSAIIRKDGKSRMDILPNVVAYGGLTIQQLSALPQGSSERAQQLNPLWVEWLMGWCIGWTDLKPLETDKFHSVQQWHSLFLQKD